MRALGNREPMHYRFNDGDDTLRYGFIAQDVKEALPQTLQDLSENAAPAHRLALIVAPHRQDAVRNDQERPSSARKSFAPASKDVSACWLAAAA